MSGGCARKWRYTLLTAGSASSISTTRFRTITITDFGHHRYGFYPYSDYYGYAYYPYDYYDDSYYDNGSCYVVNRRVHTTHGWRTRPVQVCG